MLILSRKTHQTIVIGGGVSTQPQLTLTVLEVRKGKVKLGFEADPSTSIHRSEVRDRIASSEVQVYAALDDHAGPS